MLKKVTKHRGDFIRVPFKDGIHIEALQKAVEKEKRYVLGAILRLDKSTESQIPLFINGREGLNIATINLDGDICRSISFYYTRENLKLIKEFDDKISKKLSIK